MKASAKSEIEELKKRIRRHDYLYHVLSRPEISDKEYDDLLRRLGQLEERYPEYKTQDSPTTRVGGGILPGFKTLRHRQKMLSLDNTYSIEEVLQWDARVRKGLGEPVSYVTELKIDGLSASLTYERGLLTRGATRGDGEVGEDVTQNIRTMRSVPLSLTGGSVPGLIEIRGEVYMERADFNELNRRREQEGETAFANPRNAAAGSLKLLDPSIVARRSLRFYAHSLGEYSGRRIRTHEDFLKQLNDWGMRTNPHAQFCPSIEEAIQACASWQEKRDELEYEIDGMVIKVNDLQQREALGATLKSPRWAIAFKFPARQATTEVLRIKLNVGRTGVITPAAELAPVECGGVVIRNATLHNFEEIERLGIREKDRVLIERAGDVIPKIVAVVERRGSGSFRVPARCPACGGAVIKEKEKDVAYRCINPLCPAQVRRSVLHFASRSAMDIEGMGESVVDQLVTLDLVKNVSDIYSLTPEDLARLELFKQKKIKNLLAAIEGSKTRDLWRLVYGLGIRHVGEKAAYVLSRTFGSMDRLMGATVEELERIPEIGGVIAGAVSGFFSQKQTRELVERLRAAGVSMSVQKSSEEPKNTSLSGKTIVFTGELETMTRAEAEQAARQAGAATVSSVSSKTDFVVAGTKAGSKLARARDLNVQVIDEKRFKALLTERDKR